MGTSVSQASPRNSNWKRAFACYTDTDIGETRVIAEIWRAWENEKRPISREIKSDIVYRCLQAVGSSSNAEDALRIFNHDLIASKQNSMVAEFARRAIPVCYRYERPAEAWATKVFDQLTRYVVSRDLSGFIGSQYRNKTVSDATQFKDRLGTRASELIQDQPVKFASKRDWERFVDTSISRLKAQKR